MFATVFFCFQFFSRHTTDRPTYRVVGGRRPSFSGSCCSCREPTNTKFVQPTIVWPYPSAVAPGVKDAFVGW